MADHEVDLTMMARTYLKLPSQIQEVILGTLKNKNKEPNTLYFRTWLKLHF